MSSSHTVMLQAAKASSVGGAGRAYQAGREAPYATQLPMVAGLPGSAARKMFRQGQQDGRAAAIDPIARSSRPDVRNPLLALPAMQKLRSLDDGSKLAIRVLLLNIRKDAQDRAEKCWRTHKAPMAAYWKVVAVYAGHTARALRTDEQKDSSK